MTELTHENIFKFFVDIAAIVPRGSGQEKNISDYMVEFAKQRHLEVHQDIHYNTVIKKNASKGYENSPTIMLQAHMDMVNEKDEGVEHNFDKDPLKLVVKDGWIHAQGTTLGADDGAGMAMIMAVLDDNLLEHGPIEVLLTTSEETGMTGILQFIKEPYNLQASYLINLDTGEECTISSSCLGGSRTDMRIPFTKVNPKGEAYQISILGLKGGHSGIDIDKGLGNANKLLGRFLRVLMCEMDFHIADVWGGSKENVIPREAHVIVFIDPRHSDILEKVAMDMTIIYKKEFAEIDTKVNLIVNSLNILPKFMLDTNSTYTVVHALDAHPNGVLSRSTTEPSTPKTSLNLAVIVKEEDNIRISSNVRSSLMTELQGALNMLMSFTELIGGSFHTRNRYAPWEFDSQSKLLPLAAQTSQKIFGKEAKSFAIPAGTEVGVIKSLFHNKLDAISIGPTMTGIHTSDEKLNIESFRKTYKWLLAILKALNE